MGSRATIVVRAVSSALTKLPGSINCRLMRPLMGAVTRVQSQVEIGVPLGRCGHLNGRLALGAVAECLVEVGLADRPRANQFLGSLIVGLHVRQVRPGLRRLAIARSRSAW